MATWQYSIGHVWRYDGNDVPAGMNVRFEANAEAKAAGLCGCECGVCGPGHAHTVDEGCICAPLSCPCLDGETTGPSNDGGEGKKPMGDEIGNREE